MSRSLVPHDAETRVLSTAPNPDNDWTPQEYLDVLYMRRACGMGDRISLDVRIETVEICYLGKTPDDPAWLEFREWEVA